MKDKEQSLAAEASSEEYLEQLLREELDKKQPDRETVLSILETLEQRETTHKRQQKVKVKPLHWIWKTAIAVAAVLTFAFIAPPVFGAENIFVLVGTWTRDLFMLYEPQTTTENQIDDVYHTDHPDLQRLHDALVEIGITQRVVPSWLPSEFNLSEIKTVTENSGIYVYANFLGNSNYIFFAYGPITEDFGKKYPKTDVSAIVHEVEGIKHYIVLNEDLWTVAWGVDALECTIVTNYDMDTICRIIDSVYLEEE